MIAKDNRIGVQRRAERKNGWTVAVRAKFLEVLAETCNVTAASAAVGKPASSARMVKKRDGEFAQLWAEAFAQGQERLQEELLAHALGQTPSGENPNGIPEAVSSTAFDPQLALKILQLQHGAHHARKRVGRVPAQADIDQALLVRLELLAERLAEK